MAMIENTPSGVAMSASVRTGLVVAVGMELLLDVACADAGGGDGDRRRLQREGRGSGNAGLGYDREFKVVDYGGLGAADTGHARPSAAGHRAAVRRDDAMQGVQQAARLGRGVARGRCPDGGRAGVVTNAQDDVVARRSAPGQFQAGRQWSDLQGRGVQAIAGRVVGGVEQAEDAAQEQAPSCASQDRKSTRLNSSHSSISYAVFCLKKKKNTYTRWFCRNKLKK